MNEYDAYYEENVYPLQNGVLKTLAGCAAPFYLTGGTITTLTRRRPGRMPGFVRRR